MIELMGVKLPEGDAILLTAEVGGAVSDLKNKKHTIVYTDTFCDGITVDMPIDEFFTLWMTCLMSDLEVVEMEEADSVH